MNQTVRTATFLVVAGVALAIAAGTHYANRPADLSQFSDNGQKFYPKFEDPNAATALQVASYNAATGKTDVFSIDFKDGLWRIPSHHNYPADGKDRLAQVASSMIGVERTALIESTAAAHKRYNLLDPLQADIVGTEGRGSRITLKKNDEPLVDFIVGKKVEGAENTYYVRRADEDRFYTADLGKFEVSTKFSDWIEKDVLDVAAAKIRELLINRYFVDEARGAVVQEDQIKLNRTSANAPWDMEGLDVDKQEVKTAEVTNLLSTLDSLQIVGVRPKPERLSDGLRGDGAVSIDAFARMDLQSKGFFIHQGQFISNEGEVTVGTDEGVLYVLGFGEEFSGNEVEIEVGAAKPAGDAAKPDAKPEAKPETPAPDGQKKSRYLFVLVQFDQALLGPSPVAPQKPEAPATPPAEGAAPAAADAAAKKYKEDLEDFELQKKTYDDKVTAGKKRVADLNRRFANWFYVIPGDVFDKLKLKREDLVQAKTKPETPAGEEKPATDAGGLLNGLNLDSLKNMLPNLQPQAPAGDAPAQQPPAVENPPVSENPMGQMPQNPPAVNAPVENAPAGEVPPANAPAPAAENPMVPGAANP